jgi:hypothetical protein
MSNDWISATELMTPSLRLKPIAKSSKSCGVAIITAWVPPLYVNAMAVSSGTERIPALRPLFRQI